MSGAPDRNVQRRTDRQERDRAREVLVARRQRPLTLSERVARSVPSDERSRIAMSSLPPHAGARETVTRVETRRAEAIVAERRASLTLAPAIAFYLLAQKHIIAGLTSGAVKG